MKLFLMCAAGVCVLALAAQADEPFARRAGKWQITLIQKDGKPDTPDQFCYRAASIADITKRMGDCSRRDVRTTGNTTTIDAVCTKDNRQSTFHMTIAAASDSSYHAEMHTTFSPAIQGTSSVDLVEDAKWLGPCAPGEEPVD
jgi:hypothetical protein